MHRSNFELTRCNVVPQVVSETSRVVGYQCKVYPYPRREIELYREYLRVPVLSAVKAPTA